VGEPASLCVVRGADPWTPVLVELLLEEGWAVVHSSEDLARGQRADAWVNPMIRPLDDGVAHWDALEELEAESEAAWRTVRDGGSIINLISVFNAFTDVESGTAPAVHAAAAMLTKTHATQLAGRGTRANAVAVVERDDAALHRIPLRRYPSPLDIAEAIVFLASADASYVTGEVLAVDGGLGAHQLF
jgi:NAD(P)-dependent dehydrogenase (short-subunit alcohol dehydrogenase family)